MASEENKNRPRVLADHRRVGKRFIPPFMSMAGSFHEVGWVDDILPELLWLSLLNDRYGLRQGAELAIKLPKATLPVVTPQESWLALTSTYSTLTPSQWGQIVDSLDGLALTLLREAFRPLVALYPECPLRGIFSDTDPRMLDDDVSLLQRSVEEILDRGGRPATLAQANAVYILFVTGKLQVAKGLALANFPAVADYPSTDESRRVGASVRAAVTGFVSPPIQNNADGWVHYFWRRGLDISPCRLTTE